MNRNIEEPAADQVDDEGVLFPNYISSSSEQFWSSVEDYSNFLESHNDLIFPEQQQQQQHQYQQQAPSSIDENEIEYNEEVQNVIIKKADDNNNQDNYYGHKGLEIGHQSINKTEYFHGEILETLLKLFASSSKPELNSLHNDLRHYYLSSEFFGKNFCNVDYRFSRRIEKLQEKEMYTGPSIGRVYAWTKSKYSPAYKAHSLQTFPKWIRAALANMYYFDLDMVNAHPCILLSIAKKYINLQRNHPEAESSESKQKKKNNHNPFANLEYYCQHRQEVLELAHSYLRLKEQLQQKKVSKEQVEKISKKFMTAIFYGANIQKFASEKNLQINDEFEKIIAIDEEECATAKEKGDDDDDVATHNNQLREKDAPIVKQQQQIAATTEEIRTTKDDDVPATTKRRPHKILFSFRKFRDEVKSFGQFLLNRTKKMIFEEEEIKNKKRDSSLLTGGTVQGGDEELFSTKQLINSALSSAYKIVEQIPLLETAQFNDKVSQQCHSYSIHDLLLTPSTNAPKKRRGEEEEEEEKQNPLLTNVKKKTSKYEGGNNNKISVFLAYFLQEIERNIMGTLEKLLVVAGRRIDVYIHDGFLIRKNVFNPSTKKYDLTLTDSLILNKELGFEPVFPSNLLKKCENQIIKIFGFSHMQFKIKPLDLSGLTKFLDETFKDQDLTERKTFIEKLNPPRKTYKELFYHYENYWNLSYFYDRQKFLLDNSFVTKETLPEVLLEQDYLDSDKKTGVSNFVQRYVKDMHRSMYGKYVLIEREKNEDAAPSGVNIEKSFFKVKSKMINDKSAWPLLTYSKSDVGRKTLLAYNDDELLDYLKVDREILKFEPLFNLRVANLEFFKVSKLAIPFLNHYFILLGRNQEHFGYVIKYLAKIANFPAERVDGCGLLLWSEEGGNGKSTAGRMAADLFYPFGREVQSLRTVFARFSQVMEFSFLLHLEDNPLSQWKNFSGDLKSRLTAKEFPVEFKNGPIIFAENFCRLFVTANDPPFFCTPEDRRWAIFHCSSELFDKPNYFLALRNYWDNLYVRQTVLRTLLQLDVSKFHCERDRPISAINQANITFHQQFRRGNNQSERKKEQYLDKEYMNESSRLFNMNFEPAIKERGEGEQDREIQQILNSQQQKDLEEARILLRTLTTTTEQAPIEKDKKNNKNDDSDDEDTLHNPIPTPLLQKNQLLQQKSTRIIATRNDEAGDERMNIITSEKEGGLLPPHSPTRNPFFDNESSRDSCRRQNKQQQTKSATKKITQKEVRLDLLQQFVYGITMFLNTCYVDNKYELNQIEKDWAARMIYVDNDGAVFCNASHFLVAYTQWYFINYYVIDEEENNNKTELSSNNSKNEQEEDKFVPPYAQPKSIYKDLLKINPKFRNERKSTGSTRGYYYYLLLPAASEQPFLHYWMFTSQQLIRANNLSLLEENNAQKLAINLFKLRYDALNNKKLRLLFHKNDTDFSQQSEISNNSQFMMTLESDSSEIMKKPTNRQPTSFTNISNNNETKKVVQQRLSNNLKFYENRLEEEPSLRKAPKKELDNNDKRAIFNLPVSDAIHNLFSDNFDDEKTRGYGGPGGREDDQSKVNPPPICPRCNDPLNEFNHLTQSCGHKICITCHRLGFEEDKEKEKKQECLICSNKNQNNEPTVIQSANKNIDIDLSADITNINNNRMELEKDNKQMEIESQQQPIVVEEERKTSESQQEQKIFVASESQQQQEEEEVNEKANVSSDAAHSKIE